MMMKLLTQSRYQPLCECLLQHSVIDGSQQNYSIPMRIHKRKLRYCLMSQDLQAPCAVLRVINGSCVRARRPGIHDATNCWWSRETGSATKPINKCRRRWALENLVFSSPDAHGGNSLFENPGQIFCILLTRSERHFGTRTKMFLQDCRIGL